MPQSLYLDYASTTDIYPEVINVLTNMFHQKLGNPSSVHTRGKQTKTLIDRARIDVAKCFQVAPSNIIFSSGATESMHLAVVGAYLKHKTFKTEKEKKKILVSPAAHSCVQRAVDFLVDYHGAERIDIPITKDGCFNLDQLDLSEVGFVVVEHGNSETGVLQDIQSLGEMVYRQEERPVFVVDTVASIVSCPSVFEWNTEEYKPDFIMVSGEKIGGVSGAGALIQLTDRLITGIQKGSQEFGLRGGTENIIGIVALAKALCIHYRNRENIAHHMQDLSVYAQKLISDQIPSLIKIGSENTLNHVLVYLLPEGMKSDLFVTQCDMQGLMISSGSACSSGTVGGNKALQSLGVSEEESSRSIRLSFGRNTTKEDVYKAVEIIQDLVGN